MLHPRINIFRQNKLVARARKTVAETNGHKIACAWERVCVTLWLKVRNSCLKQQIQLGVVTPGYTPSTGQVEVEGYLSFVCQVVCK